MRQLTKRRSLIETLSTAVLLVCISNLANAIPETLPPSLRGVHRILFLGDSITYSGQYIEYLDAFLATRYPGEPIELINAGLPSETVSGLSEPGHAGGAFPRPDLHERLDRAMAKTRPDMVVACYGMNDGIYFPLSEDRFAKYREGITKLVEKVKMSGAKLLILTPPVFDPEPIRANTLPAGLDAYPKPYVGYDEVLTAYSKWLISQRSKGWLVADIHGPMRKFLDMKRLGQTGYRLADDGVHANSSGHRIMAEAVRNALKIGKPVDPDDENGWTSNAAILKLSQDKQRILKDAWLTEIGHTRPGMAKGLPIADARIKARELDKEIRTLAQAKNP